MLFTDRASVSVALVGQSQSLHQHLRAALDEVGALVVYEVATTGFDLSALERSGASVVVVNLDPANEEEITQIEALLIDETRKVIFNDGEVTSRLSGWDQARWARHLAAKIMGDTQLLPARPAGSEAVPVRDMPQHGLDSVFKPAALQAPVVTGEAEDRAAQEIGDALSSFVLDPRAAAAPTQARDELEAALNDFGFFAAHSDSDSASVNDLAAMVRAPEVSALEANVSEVSAGSSLSAASVQGPPAHASVARTSADELFSDFDFSEARAGAQHTAVDVAHTPSDSAFADIQFDFDERAAPEAGTAVAAGLDDFLEQHSYRQQQATAERSAPTASAPTAHKTAVDVSSLMSSLSFELSPMDEEASAGAPTASPAVAVASDVIRGDLSSAFDDVLSSLSLQPLDDEVSTPVASAVLVPDAAAAPANTFGGMSFELDPFEATAESTVGLGALDSDNPFANLEFGVDTYPSAAVAESFSAQLSGQSTAGDPIASGLSGSFSRVWVLGASIGGPDAVREFLAGIPRSTSCVFLLAQHMGADFIDLMVSQLAKATALEVKMATSGSAARPGQVLIVPLAERMLLTPDGDVRVVPLDTPSPYSPSIDQVLFDVADQFGARAGAIIFSGMAHDAIEGAKYLASKGGMIWVQDPATCVVSSMIDGAVEAGVARYQGGPAELAQKFVAEFG